MVVFAKGQPLTKSREMDGQMPFEEWVYGTPPEDVVFVRVNGNRVIRVEVARDGKSPQIFTQDVVSPMLRGGGLPTVAAAAADKNTRVIREGDVQRVPNRQDPAPPPTLGKPNPNDTSATSNTDAGGRDQTMRPVQLPTQQPDNSTTLGGNPDDQQPIGAPPIPDASQSGAASMPGTGRSH